jgi:hypothetical protein
MADKNAPGQYLYQNYLAVFGTVFAPSWRELTEESRSNWAKLELATKIDCTCNSDPLGRCIVHPPSAGVSFIPIPQGCQAFMSPGPPWYAAQCRLKPGHEGEHDCGTVEEARAAWDASVAHLQNAPLPQPSPPVVHYSPSEHRYFPADWEVRPSLAEASKILEKLGPAPVSKSEVMWHPKGCDCGNCAGGTMPVQVLTVTLPSANAPESQPSSTPEKSVDEKEVD